MDFNWNQIFSEKGSQDRKLIKQDLESNNFIKSFKIINVVGTNGKGSVSKILSDSLIASGHNVGLFTSPHINEPNERIKFNGKDISTEDFTRIYKKLKPSFFFGTLYKVAMLYFQEIGVDYVILEAGIGGHRDTTSIYQGEVGLLTSISLDHTDILGDTEEMIARDKGKVNTKKLYYPSTLKQSLKKEMPKGSIELSNEGSNYKETNLKLASNFLKKEFGINKIISNKICGRTQLVKINGKKHIIDVAHNKDGIKSSLKLIKDKGYEYDQVVISISKRKDINGIIKLFKNKDIKYIKIDKTYHDFENIEETNFDKINFKKKTLFIGSFKLIDKVIKLKKKIPIKEKLKDQFKLSIQDITMAAIFVGVWIVSSIFIKIDFKLMQAGITYAIAIVVGLYFKPLVAVLIAVIADSLSLAAGIGLGGWMWEYAIIYPTIVLVVGCFKGILDHDKKIVWIGATLFLFTSTIIVSIVITILNNNFYKASDNPSNTFDFTSLWSKILIWLMISLMIFSYITLYIWYFKTGNVNVKNIIIIFAIVSFVIILFIWVWGPIADIRFLKRMGFTKKSYSQLYHPALIVRVLKTPIILPLYTAIIIPLYKVKELSIAKGKRW